MERSFMGDLGIMYREHDALKNCVTWERGLSPELWIGVLAVC